MMSGGRDGDDSNEIDASGFLPYHVTACSTPTANEILIVMTPIFGTVPPRHTFG